MSANFYLFHSNVLPNFAGSYDPEAIVSKALLYGKRWLLLSVLRLLMARRFFNPELAAIPSYLCVAVLMRFTWIASGTRMTGLLSRQRGNIEL